MKPLNTTAEATELPLVSLILLAYNQAQYIREAVSGLLAQDYQTLEIILSDDCSSDQTYEIMVEIADHYDGPHSVKTNRCLKNGGLASHINQAVAMCSGELIVIAAGDDISLPNRVDTLAEAWRQNGQNSGSIYSGYVAIDESGVVGEERKPAFQTDGPAFWMKDSEAMWNQGVFGCTHAWTRDVFEVFGDLRPEIIYEDRAIPFRSAILGNVSFVTEPLVKYRILSDSLCRSTRSDSRRERFKHMSKYYRRRHDVLIQHQLDLKTAFQKQLISSVEFENLQTAMQTELRRCDTYREMMETGLWKRLKLVASARKPFTFYQRMKFLMVALKPDIYGSPMSNFILKFVQK